jgi:hypothetical protein
VRTLDLDFIGSVDTGFGCNDVIAGTGTREVLGHELYVLTLEKLIDVRRGMNRPKDRFMLMHLEATLEERERMQER